MQPRDLVLARDGGEIHDLICFRKRVGIQPVSLKRTRVERKTELVKAGTKDFLQHTSLRPAPA